MQSFIETIDTVTERVHLRWLRHSVIVRKGSKGKEDTRSEGVSKKKRENARSESIPLVISALGVLGVLHC